MKRGGVQNVTGKIHWPSSELFTHKELHVVFSSNVFKQIMKYRSIFCTAMKKRQRRSNNHDFLYIVVCRDERLKNGKVLLCRLYQFNPIWAAENWLAGRKIYHGANYIKKMWINRELIKYVIEARGVRFRVRHLVILVRMDDPCMKQMPL